MTFWAEAKRLSYVTAEETFSLVVAALQLDVPVGTSPGAFRDVYRSEICAPDGWPRSFPLVGGAKVEEGLVVKSLSGAITGRTTGNRRKCLATSTNCPGWFVEVVWETGQRLWPCSEGWHFDPQTKTISIIGGGEISARFITPKPLGTQPAPRNMWPTRKELLRMPGWRVVH